MGEAADALAVAWSPEDVLVVGGEVDLSTAPVLAAALERVPQLRGDVVLDLADVAFLDSAGLNVLVRTLKALDGSPRRLRVRGAQRAVRTAIEAGGIAGLLVLEG